MNNNIAWNIMRTKKRRLILLALAIVVLCVIVVRTQFFWTTMESNSMNSSGARKNDLTIRAGDDVVAVRFMRRFLKKGDLAVVELDTKSDGSFTPTVRRIAGTAGDAYQNHTNGSEIPHGYYYVTGDSTNALDSRQLGLIRSDRIIGKVVWVLSDKNSERIAREP